MELLQTTCINCGAEVEAVAGSSVNCNYCGSKFTIPAPVAPGANANYNAGANNEDDEEDEEGMIDIGLGDDDDDTPAFASQPSHDFVARQNFAVAVPTRLTIFKKNIRYGFLLWILWGIIRGMLPVFFGDAYQIDAHYTDHLFYAHLGTPYYLLGGAIFIFGFPLLMCTVFYNRLIQKYKNLFVG